ncbi:MAG: hypothetical protein V7L21_35805 [Nostoc sp.]|uniref:hypothetical protein n=1 Tax=Nostoc sp. TaxID=1180 RepID=UPI002FF902BC
MKFNQLLLSLIIACSIIPPAIAQGSLPSLEDTMMRDRVREQQSLDAQAQYNAFHSQAPVSEGNMFVNILGISGALGVGVFLAQMLKYL